MFLKNHKKVLKWQKCAIFFKTLKILVFEILAFGYYLEEKRQLKTTVYMNASTS